MPRQLHRRTFFLALVCAVLAISAVATSRAAAQTAPAPPKTRTDNVKEVLHGVEIMDPYRWLEDQNSPETRAWINAENEYTQSILGKVPGRDRLKERLAELLKVDTVTAPRACSGRYFFTKRRASQDLSVIYVRQGLKGNDEVLVDPHPLSPDHTVSVSLLDVTKDGKLLAYGTRRGGEDEVAVTLLEVDSRKKLPDFLPRARYFGVQLKDDKSGFYYTRFEKAGPRVYYHEMGKPPSSDQELFGKGYGPEKIINAVLSENQRHLLITVHHGSAARKTEIYHQDLSNGGAITPIVNDVEARFTGEFAGDRLFLDTNWEAPNGRILEVDPREPARDHWREIIPTGKAVIQGFSLVGGRLFINYLEDVVSRVKVFEPDGKHLRDISFGVLGTVGAVSGRWHGDEAFFSFNSFYVPPTIYHYEVAGGAQDVWDRQQVPINTDNFTAEQVWYESKDGTRVPMFLVHQKDVKRDGTNPTLLTGYGGFNLSRTPAFSPLAVLWVERGGVFALPNLRGGGEFGEAWHRAGMLEKKQNVFDDFIAAAGWLIANHYTQASKLAISGGSNGGLLVGAALTQRPDLFQAVVCSVPLLDMLRYDRFLVARFWVPEYGSATDAKQFEYIRAYSPYQNVKPGTRYPAVLFISGDSDTRVAPLHARKMAALMQAAGSDRPVLLHYDTKAGHSGGKPVTKMIDDMTDELSFLFWQLKVAE
jgi:prolyl oligopeptidase